MATDSGVVAGASAGRGGGQERIGGGLKSNLSIPSGNEMSFMIEELFL